MTAPRYGVIGKGRWGGRIAEILGAHGRMVTQIAVSRPEPGLSRSDYAALIGRAISASSANTDILWLAVPPGFQDLFVEQGLEAGKHIVVEKPWMCGPGRTNELISASRRLNRLVAVHFQYCFLDAVRNAAANAQAVASFSGVFTISRPDRLFLDPLYNLGSHLAAIKCLYFKQARTGQLVTGYNTQDRRSITLELPGEIREIDFLDNKEPLIQRFIDAFEKSISTGSPFPVDLNLALDAGRLLEEVRG